jgi:hypothetical protein
MNIGGIRTDLIYKASESEGPGNVTYGEAFSVQPFGILPGFLAGLTRANGSDCSYRLSQ